jgi:hypothetical protein
MRTARRLWGSVTNVKLSRMQPYARRRPYLHSPRGKATWIVHYEYEDPFGGKHHGKSGYVRFDPGPALQAGDKVGILFDPEHPSGNMWAGPLAMSSGEKVE